MKHKRVITRVLLLMQFAVVGPSRKSNGTTEGTLNKGEPGHFCRTHTQSEVSSRATRKQQETSALGGNEGIGPTSNQIGRGLLDTGDFITTRAEREPATEVVQ